MIYDDITEREWYMYRRGEMREYVRINGPFDTKTLQALSLWIETGHDVHSNPWGIRNPKSGSPVDFVAAMHICETTK